MRSNLRLIYMAGGASYTIDLLKKILETKHKVVHTYTKFPQPAGRGKKIIPSPLQGFLEKKKLPYSMTNNFKTKSEVEKLESLKPDLVIVFSYGVILPQIVLDIPRWGCINIHASLLPKWRGASPVQYALLNNEKETGYSVMIMNKGIDEGKVLCKKVIKITNNDNTISLLKKITNLAGQNISTVIDKYVSGSIKPVSQNHNEASYTRIIKKNETYLNFNDSAETILGKIRAFNPNPGAKCFINGELIKIIEAKKEFTNDNDLKSGIIIDKKLLIACKDNAIRPTVIQRSGKTALKLEEVLNGWKVTPGTMVKSSL